jgi:hypothetical protein
MNKLVILTAIMLLALGCLLGLYMALDKAITINKTFTVAGMATWLLITFICLTVRAAKGYKTT